MGFERDYLMRQLMMLLEVVTLILRFRKKGETEKAMEQISYFYHCLDIEKDIRQMNIEELTKFLVTDKKLTNDHIEMVAFVLKEQGEIEVNGSVKTDLFRKAWFLLDKVERESITFSMDRQMKIAELKDFLN